MTKDEFRNKLAAALYDTYENTNPNILGVYANSIELGSEEDTDFYSPQLFLRYTRQRKVGGNDTTESYIYSLEDIMEMVCDD